MDPLQTQVDKLLPLTGVKSTDVQVRGAELYFLPVHTRVPLRFGTETLTSVTCARVRIVVENKSGRLAEGWGETPLSVQWVWPSPLSYSYRHEALKDFCEQLTSAWADFQASGHPIEIGYSFQQRLLPELLGGFNRSCSVDERMPKLASLLCCSPFDLALHDAYGNVNERPVYQTYTAEFMNGDLSHYLEPAEDAAVTFEGSYPCDYLNSAPDDPLPVWHLVGGLDPLDSREENGSFIDDGEPHYLVDWIRRDGLSCLKVKLSGKDQDADYHRIVEVGTIAEANGQYRLSADFNCTVTDPKLVSSVLSRLREEHPSIYDAVLYVEQPFPYELETYRIDVHELAAVKPLLMDESAHTWEYVRLGRSLGWNGVALKTCKTQTGALLMQAWAKAHGMHVMVQDLTNPMLAQIPHVLLGAYAGTMLGVESNAMQFYPLASQPEARVHPGLYHRQQGMLSLTSLSGSGFGYRIHEIERQLGEPISRAGNLTLAPR